MTEARRSTASEAFMKGTGKQDVWRGQKDEEKAQSKNRKKEWGEGWNRLSGGILLPLMKAEGAVLMFSYLFYRNLMAILVLQPLAVYLVKRIRRKELEVGRQKLSGQFKDGLLALAASLRAGHSAENAFQDAAKELAFLYGTEERITREFKRVVSQIGMNVPLEQAVVDLAIRCSLPDIQVFSEVFSAARRTGGGLCKVILDTVQTITGRLEVREEIYTMLRGKQYEQKVMRAVPPLLLLYMDLTSPGFFSVLYETLLGRGIMTGCLVVYLAAVVLAEKISDIQV